MQNRRQEKRRQPLGQVTQGRLYGHVSPVLFGQHALLGLFKELQLFFDLFH